MLKNKHLTTVLLLSALMCGCSAENSGQNVSETSPLTENTSLQAVTSDEAPAETTVQTVISDETTDETTAETTPETEPKSTEQLSLEALIDERAGGKEAAEICFSIFDDFDGDGTDELFTAKTGSALYGMRMQTKHGIFILRMKNGENSALQRSAAIPLYLPNAFMPQAMLHTVFVLKTAVR